MRSLIGRATSLLPPSLTIIPVGGRLQRFLPVWRLLQVPSAMINVLRDGYILPFSRKPPTSKVPIYYKAGNLVAVREQVLLLEAKQAIRRVPEPASPGYYSRLFVVPKATGGYRPVIDLSGLSQYLRVPKFRMETPASIKAALQGSPWAGTVDLSDAYFHIPIHPQASQFLRFMVDGQVWEFTALPFGLASAPFLFTWILRPFLCTLRRFGVRIHAYLDDWIIHHPDKAVLNTQLQLTVQLATLMGYMVNREKSQLQPMQTFIQLGMEFNLLQQVVKPPLAKCQDIGWLIRAILQSPATTARRWTSLLGKLGYIAALIPLGRLHVRELQLFLRRSWNFNWKNRDQLLPLTENVRSALPWWLQLPVLRSETALELPTYTEVLMTDASTEGWGAHLGHHTARGFWPPHYKLLHINELEMLAVTLAICQFQPILHDKTILIATDNTTVLGHLRNQGGTRSPAMVHRTFEFFETAAAMNLNFRCRHTPGRKNILADQLSQAGQTIPSEWTLNQEVVDDAFTTCLNHRLPDYFSPVVDPAALAVDAMTQAWSRASLYMFPPRPLIPAVLRKLQRPHADVVLVIPWDETAPWFPWLLQLSQVPGFQRRSLPQVPDLQPLVDARWDNLQELHLTACFLPRRL